MSRDAQVTIRLTSDELERFQALADKYGTTRQKLIYSVLVNGLDTLEQLDVNSMFKAALYVNQATHFITDFISDPTGKQKKAKKT